MVDAEPVADESAAEVLEQAGDPVVAAGAAGDRHLDAACVDREIVVGHDEVANGGLVEVEQAAQGAAGGEFGNTGTGFTGGIIAGYNWQFAPQWVAGVEGDFSWLGIKHSLTEYNDLDKNYELNTHWLATARARLGYSTGPALLYVTGGGAWVNYEETWQAAGLTSSSTKTLGGYAVGGGIETPFTFFGLLGPGLLARSEYLYVNVGDGDTLTQAGFPVVANHQFHVFRGALLYRFGG